MPNPKLSESDYDEIWNLQPLKDIPVKNLLKQAENMRTDANYPICETAYVLLKDICNVLQDWKTVSKTYINCHFFPCFKIFHVSSRKL